MIVKGRRGKSVTIGDKRLHVKKIISNNCKNLREKCLQKKLFNIFEARDYSRRRKLYSRTSFYMLCSS
jgi:UDP-N-acetylmuramate-alanine ligase